MIDTDEYEGHKEGEWVITCADGITWDIHTVSGEHLVECRLHNTVSNFVLMRDAPLLLAEVKRLREEIKDYDACLQNLWDKELIPEDTDIWDEVKELLEVIE